MSSAITALHHLAISDSLSAHPKQMKTLEHSHIARRPGMLCAGLKHAQHSQEHTDQPLAHICHRSHLLTEHSEIVCSMLFALLFLPS